MHLLARLSRWALGIVFLFGRSLTALSDRNRQIPVTRCLSNIRLQHGSCWFIRSQVFTTAFTFRPYAIPDS